MSFSKVISKHCDEDQIKLIALPKSKLGRKGGSGSHFEWELDGSGSHCTKSRMEQDFYFYFFTHAQDLDRTGLYYVGVGWNRSKN